MYSYCLNIASIFHAFQTKLLLCSTSSRTHPTSGHSDWLKRDPRNMYTKWSLVFRFYSLSIPGVDHITWSLSPLSLPVHSDLCVVTPCFADPVSGCQSYDRLPVAFTRATGQSFLRKHLLFLREKGPRCGWRYRHTYGTVSPPKPSYSRTSRD